MNKRILALLHFPPPEYGMTLLNKNIVEGSLKDHFTFEVIAINTSKKLKIIEQFSFAKILTFTRLYIILLIKLLKNRYQLCYFSLSPTGLAFCKDLLFVLLVKIFRIKLLYHLHGKGISSNTNFLKGFLYKLCFKNSRVIIIAKSLGYDIERYVDNKNVYIVPNGIKGKLADEDFEEILNKRVNKNTINLLFLSNMIRTKGVFFALEAAKILAEKGYDFNFYFAGDWCDINEKEFSATVKRYNLNKVIHYLGFIREDAKYKLLEKSDIFIHPTCKDAFPLVLLEAMEFGVPALSTYEGAIPEIVDDGITGFLVSNKTPQVLVERIETLLNNPGLRIRMGRSSREKFLREYTFDKFELNLFNVFNLTKNEKNET